MKRATARWKWQRTYLAQKRGFSPGYAMQDWLAAEEEIDRQEGKRGS